MNGTPGSSLIASPQNPWVKDLVNLRKDGEARRAQRRFFLEGLRGVEAALNLEHVAIHELVLCEHLLSAEAHRALSAGAQRKGVSIVRVSKDVFKKLADVVTPQGAAAVVAMPEWSLEGMLATPQPLLVVACGIQDPGNLGTLIRSCEAAGAAGLIALEGTADPYNAKVVRSTAAGLLALPILRMRGAAFLEAVRSKVNRLVAADASAGTSYRNLDWKRRPLALCIGSEGAGLPPELEAACRERVAIPMRGSAESLNAAVAASILLFEAQAEKLTT